MKIIIIDDDRIVVSALEQIISADEEIEVTAVGYCYEDAVRLYDQYKPDIAMLDIRMGEKTGILAAKDIINKNPDAKILFLTTFTDSKYISQSLQIGAKGYIIKQDFNSIIPALKAIYMGQSVFGKEFIDKIPKSLFFNEGDDLKDLLLERENEILALVAKGNNNKEIAQLLYLSEGTVRNYISQMLEKLNLRDRTQLAIFYYNSSAFKE